MLLPRAPENMREREIMALICAIDMILHENEVDINVTAVGLLFVVKDVHYGGHGALLSAQPGWWPGVVGW